MKWLESNTYFKPLLACGGGLAYGKHPLATHHAKANLLQPFRPKMPHSLNRFVLAFFTGVHSVCKKDFSFCSGDMVAVGWVTCVVRFAFIPVRNLP
jgi:hypothetical protein